MSTVDLTDLAWDLASEGFVGREAAVLRVARHARAEGVPAVLTDVLADDRQPEVVRSRAFGRVAGFLAAAGSTRPDTTAARVAA